MSRPLYCECGGLIKTKPKEVSKSTKSLYGYTMQKYFYESKKVISKYKCSKCGKEYS
jgi:hypothetical protein